MTRLELYHQKPKHKSWKGRFFFIVIGMVLAACLITYWQYDRRPIDLEAPVEEQGDKVVIDLPNGQKVYTFDHLIFEKDGKMYYKGERNTIDLTGGTVVYENWQEPK